MTESFVDQRTELHLRIWGEFREMPGLRITLDQACRLFGGQPTEVAAALQDLVNAAVLRQIGPYYLRADWENFTA